jgi:hypothetical protein
MEREYIPKIIGLPLSLARARYHQRDFIVDMLYIILCAVRKLGPTEIVQLLCISLCNQRIYFNILFSMLPFHVQTWLHKICSYLQRHDNQPMIKKIQNISLARCGVYFE